MSADNGVYILHDSKEGTWRVAHLQAIDNLDWFVDKMEQAKLRDGDTTPYDDQMGNVYPSATEALEAYIIESWGSSHCYREEMTALQKAAEILHSLDICEYGISFVEMPDINVRWLRST